jgi:hypothetical protein
MREAAENLLSNEMSARISAEEILSSPDSYKNSTGQINTSELQGVLSLIVDSRENMRRGDIVKCCVLEFQFIRFLGVSHQYFTF